MDYSDILMKKLLIPNPVTSISSGDGRFIRDWVSRHNLSKTIEIGFAYGVSAAFIMSAHEATHIAVDPYQQHFEGIGLRNIEGLGFHSRLEFHGDFSHNVLPQLLKRNQVFDFAFVDGGHLFDEILIDFYLLDKMIVDGGFILFDDAWMQSTLKVVSFITSNRMDYKHIEIDPRNFVLLQKTGTDRREWDHYRDF